MFRIRKLDIFVTKQFMLLFVGTFFICQFVLMMQFLWRYVDELIGKGLSLEVMAQFFWYMGLMLMPQAFPLAILLSSLITFGNLGESSELTAIKAAGISLMQTFRPLIFIVLLISLTSYYFQDVVGPRANLSFYQLLLSVKHKSPELEIPEGIFYDGLPGSNIYVQKKNLETGMLYGIMIYRQTGSYEDQAIILADSGMMQTTEEKKHLLLTLYSGEWFENMRSQDLANSANIPYRRETFSTKRIVLDFDSGLNLADMADVSGDARAKSLSKILHDMDSIKENNDSIGYSFYLDAKRYNLRLPTISKEDSLKIMNELAAGNINSDTLYERQSTTGRQEALKNALSSVQSMKMDMEIKADYAKSLHRYYRHHQLEAIKKFTLALSCLIFFFIGAPLGAIIRKGGLGMPIVISVLLFIVYYIIDNMGYKLARDGRWEVWQGMWLSSAVLLPLGVFLTHKAVNDSAVFNPDAWLNFLRRFTGLHQTRKLEAKEVIINEVVPADALTQIADLKASCQQFLDRYPARQRYIDYWQQGYDKKAIKSLATEVDNVVDYLSNSRDQMVLNKAMDYPVIRQLLTYQPVANKTVGTVLAALFPIGLPVWLVGMRHQKNLRRDIQLTIKTCDQLTAILNGEYNREMEYN